MYEERDPDECVGTGPRPDDPQCHGGHDERGFAVEACEREAECAQARENAFASFREQYAPQLAALQREQQQQQQTRTHAPAAAQSTLAAPQFFPQPCAPPTAYVNPYDIRAQASEPLYGGSWLQRLGYSVLRAATGSAGGATAEFMHSNPIGQEKAPGETDDEDQEDEQQEDE